MDNNGKLGMSECVSGVASDLVKEYVNDIFDKYPKETKFMVCLLLGSAFIIEAFKTLK